MAHTAFRIGIACFNDAPNIAALLQRILDTADARLAGITVVSDESRDGTDEVVREFAARATVPIELIANPKRAGKAAAVNQIIAAAGTVPVIVLISADALPEAGCIARLVDAFQDPRVGVAAARVVPVGPRGNLAASMTALLFDLHHEIVLAHPKSTEITAFRNLGTAIPADTLVDEAELEAAARRAGLTIRYVPEARILSNSPLTLRDYWIQRSRVMEGHARLAKQSQYRVPTMSTRARLAAAWRWWLRHPFQLPLLVFAATFETAISARGFWRSRFGARADGTWQRTESTKRAVERTRKHG